MKIYAEHEKPTTSVLKRKQQRQFWKHNFNPITGTVTAKVLNVTIADNTAEIIDLKKPAFRLAI